jgi:hypothetical protein
MGRPKRYEGVCGAPYMGGAKARLAWAAARASDLLWLVAMILFLAAMYVRILVCPGKTRKQLDGKITHTKVVQQH